MSTRANIVIQDSRSKLYFYRHSDGYPECTMESLKEFVDMYKTQLRGNISQSAGWLILKGAVEYGFKGDLKDPSGDNNKYEWNTWKVGAYEPTTDIHGDIEYLYIINLEDKTLKCYKVGYNEDTWEVNMKATMNTKPVAEYSFLNEEEKKLIKEV
jgi:hypothetical protein